MNASPRFRQPGAEGGETSAESEERAASILFEMRGQITGAANISPTAHLAPMTPEQLLYDTYPCLACKAGNTGAEPPKRSKVIESLGKVSLVQAIGIFYLIQSKQEFVDKLSKYFDVDNHSVENMIEIVKAIESSPAWGDCSPDSPVAAFVPVLLNRWKRNRIDRPRYYQQKNGNTFV
ncbi:hypothetical protein TWF225_003422 [Orbilia oligospora]|uniref:Uncharacterized protein n=1 Tax=Orbilia oligospora TaxID=2813651 RepID=A0A7C8PTT9_ORBOL|nr:hypothetical protein TWF751_000311 [Orbilia oligospora]KAF3188454.1 hypothetical protein TWF225_003422 [Orbilia oligospora]KAF3250071.1 hypothetical protein TWF128_007646 [Orbilia oligospora]KAF3263227.1 hypothetical protein TWF217_003661 [Orbilia oligospora]TGJ71108.1 hypothetical protein EYR41_003100 [Orbilia oligospora]